MAMMVAAADDKDRGVFRSVHLSVTGPHVRLPAGLPYAGAKSGFSDGPGVPLKAPIPMCSHLVAEGFRALS
ncbi:hypothetical protein Pth03_36820 [Planotetraspora thailandica]|uniref:Uncharacterized protein n=1 Tax=Planotetraspora thailandica TaxID=487172 RepID=A0A8J3XYY2_9ACTN|nr:hypothetical protein Pth03_36820 [Planotetraspora thailandica]